MGNKSTSNYLSQPKSWVPIYHCARIELFKSLIGVIRRKLLIFRGEAIELMEQILETYSNIINKIHRKGKWVAPDKFAGKHLTKQNRPKVEGRETVFLRATELKF